MNMKKGGKMERIKLKVQIIIEPDGDGFHAYCPALKGLHTCGDTEEDALKNAKDAVIAYIESLIKHAEPIPIGIVERKEVKKAPHPLRRYVNAELALAFG